MILYHYSVDSYRGGDALINDFKNQFRFAEPFLRALEKGETCFWGAYFSAMWHARELCALGLRKHENHVKDAVEGIFEFVRQTEFGEDSASRIRCVYYCESKEKAVQYLKDDCIDNGDFTFDQVKLLEVEVDDASVFRYDQHFFNQALEVMEKHPDLTQTMTLARQYFAQSRSETPLIEVVSNGQNRILREIALA